VSKRAEVPDAVADLRHGGAWHAERVQQERIPVRLTGNRQLSTRCRGGIRGEAGAERVTEPGVDGAESEGPGIARVRDRLFVLDQPGQLAGGEVRIERHAAALPHLLGAAVGLEPVERLLRALVLPGHDRRERVAGFGVPGENRLALVIEPARHDLAVGVQKQLRHRVHDRDEHVLRVLLDPARPWVLERLLPACLGQGPEVLVVKHGFHRRGTLVDSE
jgi:hypothetical protein